MPGHPHTIDRWDDATGENLIEEIAAVGDYLVAPRMLNARCLTLVRLDAQKVGDSEPYESANQRYNAENQHRPSRSSTVKFDTGSSKIEGADQHRDE